MIKLLLLEKKQGMEDGPPRNSQTEHSPDREQQFALLFQNSFNPIVIHSAGEIVKINEAVTHVFGYQPEELEGQHIFTMMPPEEQSRIMSFVYAEHETLYEMSLLRKDKTAVFVQVIAKMFDMDGKRLRMVIIQPLDIQPLPLTASVEPAPPLSEREMAVLQHLADGLTNKEIAKQLDVTTSTIKFHLSNIYKKLGVNGRSEAAHWFGRHNKP